MLKIFIFLSIIILFLIYYNYKNTNNSENFTNLENNITFSLYPKINNSGDYNSFNINISNSNLLLYKDDVYYDYINDLKDISENRVISYNIKDNIGSSNLDHTKGGKFWPSFNYSQGIPDYSSSNRMSDNTMQKLYLINNNDSNDNSMKLKDGEYYFSVWGKKKNGSNLEANCKFIFKKTDVYTPTIGLKESTDYITSDNEYFYVNIYILGGEDLIYFKPKTNKIFKIKIETSHDYNDLQIELKSTYDDNVINYSNHYDTITNKKCIENCSSDNEVSGFQNINEEDIIENSFFNLYYKDNYGNDEYDYEEEYDSIYDNLLYFMGYEREHFSKRFRKRLKKIKNKAKSITTNIINKAKSITKTITPIPKTPVYITEYTYKYEFVLDKHIEYDLKLDIAPVKDGDFKILKDNPDKDNNQIWRNIKDSYGAEFIEDNKNFNYNNEVDKRYLIDNNSGIKVTNHEVRWGMGLEDEGTLMFRGEDNNSMYGSKFHEYITRDLNKDNKILTTSNSNFNLNVTNSGDENIHQLKLIYNFLTTINDISIIQINFDTNNDLVTFYNHMHSIYIGSNKVIKKTDLTYYDSINSDSPTILLIIKKELFNEDDINNWLTETIGLSYYPLSYYKVYGF